MGASVALLLGRHGGGKFFSFGDKEKERKEERKEGGELPGRTSLLFSPPSPSPFFLSSCTAHPLPPFCMERFYEREDKFSLTGPLASANQMAGYLEFEPNSHEWKACPLKLRDRASFLEWISDQKKVREPFTFRPVAYSYTLVYHQDSSLPLNERVTRLFGFCAGPVHGLAILYRQWANEHLLPIRVSAKDTSVLEQLAQFARVKLGIVYVRKRASVK